MSGHSKWAQIKHKKAITDAKKGKLFSKMVREIAIAAKTEGGAAIDANPRLRSAIERARAIGLPKDNIERAIAKAIGGGEGSDLHEFLLEASAHGGAQMVIEGITDNTNRTFAEIRHIIHERGGRMAEPGSLLWNFQKVGILELAKADNAGKTAEDIEMAVIDSGARDFTALEDEWIVETEFTETEKVRKNLEEKTVKIREAGHDFKPKSTIALDEKSAEAFESLLEEIRDHDDVQEVYTNLGE